jgi:hypothetical protein
MLVAVQNGPFTTGFKLVPPLIITVEETAVRFEAHFPDKKALAWIVSQRNKFSEPIDQEPPVPVTVEPICFPLAYKKTLTPATLSVVPDIDPPIVVVEAVIGLVVIVGSAVAVAPPPPLQTHTQKASDSHFPDSSAVTLCAPGDKQAAPEELQLVDAPSAVHLYKKLCEVLLNELGVVVAVIVAGGPAE